MNLISNLTISMMIVSAIIAIGTPIILTIVARKKFKISFFSLFVGVLIFFVFQVIVRIPIIQILEAVIGLSTLMPYYVYVLVLSFTAGLFEESGRYLAFSVFLKNKRDFKDGLAYGIGHGGIEAIILVGIAMIVNVFYAVLINQGGFEVVFQSAMPPEQIEAMKQMFIALRPQDVLLGGFERIFAICLHLALTFIILSGFRYQKKGLYYGIALLIHTAVNFVAISLLSIGLSAWLVEGFLALVAIASIVYVIQCKKRYNDLDVNDKDEIVIEDGV